MRQFLAAAFALLVLAAASQNWMGAQDAAGSLAKSASTAYFAAWNKLVAEPFAARLQEAVENIGKSDPSPAAP
jgi:hypothetical protein